VSLKLDQKETLRRYADRTWASLAAMTNPENGLPADHLRADGATSTQTSISDIGSLLWSLLVATRLDLLPRTEAFDRLEQVLRTLSRLERHQPTGQFYNWYEQASGDKSCGEPLLSSVDNAWLATGLRVVAAGFPEGWPIVKTLIRSMNFGCYYQPNFNQLAVYYDPAAPAAAPCYDTIVSESRMATYLGITTGRVPGRAYFGPWRTFPENYVRHAQRERPVGYARTYLGVEVFEGAYQYNKSRIVPSWDGSMFEALMPSLFVPEEKWGTRSWVHNHRLTVEAQIYYGLHERATGYWGFSAANKPEGGYEPSGVPSIGMRPPESNCPEVSSLESPERLGNVVTPHASFLALRWAPAAALANLAKLEHNFPIYDQWGFRDSVNVQTGVVSDFYLALDQGMIMGAIGNALGRDLLRRAFVTPGVRATLKPLLALEEFNAGPDPID
jgi:hypothetical protein